MQKPLTFGQKIIYYREQKGWSQRELAAQSQVNVKTLHALEHGTRSGQRVAVEIAQRIARTLGVSLDYLTGMYEGEGEVMAVPWHDPVGIACP